MDSDSEQTANVQICRVCGDIGSYALWEMNFCHGNKEIPLIEAFNTFSELDNDMMDICLCESCTESLTQAYAFWERVKSSDLKFIAEWEKKTSSSSNKEQNDLIDILEPDEIVIEPKSSHQNKTKRNLNSRKSEKSSTSTTSRKKYKSCNDDNENGLNQIGVSIALPHFIITDSEFDDDDAKINENDDNDDTQQQQQQQQQQMKTIKTLTPTVFIPPSLKEIDFAMSPKLLETDGDGHSIYKCLYCTKAFAAPYHLMVHMRKSHMCLYCWTAFDKTNDLYDHVKESHKIFNCLFCQKEFQSNGNLRQHMRKNHSINLPAHISLLNVSETRNDI